jgi:50S ribosomal subunit-associated GTPase HflX
MHRSRGADAVPVILVGNKRDTVTDATAAAFDATTARVTSMIDDNRRVDSALTSAATGEGVLAVFAALVRRALVVRLRQLREEAETGVED